MAANATKNLVVAHRQLLTQLLAGVSRSETEQYFEERQGWFDGIGALAVRFLYDEYDDLSRKLFQFHGVDELSNLHEVCDNIARAGWSEDADASPESLQKSLRLLICSQALALLFAQAGRTLGYEDHSRLLLVFVRDSALLKCSYTDLLITSMLLRLPDAHIISDADIGYVTLYPPAAGCVLARLVDHSRMAASLALSQYSAVNSGEVGVPELLQLDDLDEAEQREWITLWRTAGLSLARGSDLFLSWANSAAQ